MATDWNTYMIAGRSVRVTKTRKIQAREQNGTDDNQANENIKLLSSRYTPMPELFIYFLFIITDNR